VHPTIDILFWTCLAAALVPYVGYPVMLLVLAPFARRNRVGEELPTVSLIVSAFNEEGVIAQKLENSLLLDYPKEKLEIVVISDGSQDSTDEIVRSFADQDVVLHCQEPRRGKTAGLTQFVPLAQGGIVVFSDANSMYDPDAIRKLVRHFSDPKTGYSVGHQRYVKSSSAVSVAESLYWKYETWIKLQESRLSSVVGGDGAIYAIRRELFEPLRDDDISDFTLPLQIVARGYRGVYEPEAICYEETAADFGGEFRRKARIVNRSLRAVLRVPQTLNPFRVGLFAVQLLIHKVLRWFAPFFLVGVLLTSLLLAGRGNLIYDFLLASQVVFYSVGLLRFVPFVGRQKPVYIAYYFCLVNAAAAVGIFQQVFGKRVATWTPERSLRESAATQRSSAGTSDNA